MIQRIINPRKSNSFFLFGPRGTGKSTFLKTFLKPSTPKVMWFDLLDASTEDMLLRDPGQLVARVSADAHVEWVVIDEIQKVPRLLDGVHQLIESTSVKFALTGSSARKLKQGSANLLAGRAFVNYLFPLTHREIGKDFDLETALTCGTLPRLTHFTRTEEKQDFLTSYAQIYLKEEIWAEHIIRKLDPFRKFLEIAAQANSEVINYTNISRDVGADIKTIQSYFQILEDTLIGFMLESYHRSVRKQQRESPKFYFFDPGVQRALARTLSLNLISQTYAFGKAFEHFLMVEAHRLNSYFKKDYRFSYLRTKDNVEIDLIIDRPGLPVALIEIKSSDHIDERDTKILREFTPDFKGAEMFILSRDPHPKKFGKIMALPWMQGLEEIGLS